MREYMLVAGFVVAACDGKQTAVRNTEPAALRPAATVATKTPVQPKCRAGTWAIDTIKQIPGARVPTSSAIDQEGTLHVAFASGSELLHAKRPRGGTWAIELIDNEPFSKSFVGLAIDRMSNLHVAYADESNRDLEYAFRPAAGDWTRRTIDEVGNVSGFLSIAVNDQVHISYLDIENADLKYAHGNGEDWKIEVVDNKGDAGEHTSIAVDPRGGVHMAYDGDFNRRTQAPRYAHRSASGDSTFESIPDPKSEQLNGFNSLAVDDRDGVHVTYNSFGQIHYAYRSPTGTWTSEVVSTDGKGGGSRAMAIANGEVHVVYVDETGDFLQGKLRYAHRTPDGVWTNQLVTAKPQDVWSLSLAVEPGVGIHISAHDGQTLSHSFAPCSTK